MINRFKRWVIAKLFVFVGALTASIPAVDMALGGFGLDELYGLCVAALVSLIVKIGVKTNET
ncbi:amino acid carrier protein [Roseibium sp. TrichSKD4]|uniref:hypothetical protein n=1 Tax=Roseibium sp. TrichSKD4 TaxID=744980 RepID=UPI0001E57073|nr:hypothetical protein [Roseibium sp. TrichSKD4]EFO31672.1 amino acid carrier protein [Roseibium sp. TrichSKD4]